MFTFELLLNAQVDKIISMLRMYVVSALRTLLKHKGVTWVNGLGLALGLTACLFIGHYVLFELFYDRFFPGSGQVYRVNLSIHKGGQRVYHGSKTPRNLFFALRQEVPEVEANTLTYFENTLLRYRHHSFSQQRVLWVDEGFEKVFPLTLLEGKADFKRPLTAVIAASKAKAFFGNRSPLGQIIQANEGMPLEVIGVFADLPSNTHLKADYFFSINTWQHYGYLGPTGDWVMNEWWNYLRLRPGASPAQVEQKLATILSRHMIHLKGQASTGHFFLQPLTEAHFIQGLKDELGAATNKKSLYHLLLTGVLILVVAWINFINLAAAQAQKRGKEVGIRVILGAGRLHVWQQALVEGILLNLLALLLAFGVYHLLLPAFGRYFDLPLSTAYLPTGYLWLFMAISFGLGVLFFSGYQAFQALTLTPLVARTGKATTRLFHRGLVVVQLSAAIGLVASSLFVFKQLYFMQHQHLGIELSDVIVLHGPASLNMDTTRRARYETFREQLLRHTAYSSVTATMTIPGQEPRWNKTTLLRADAVGTATYFLENDADEGILPTLRMRLLAGRNFSAIASQNRYKLLINEQARKTLGFISAQQAVGMQVRRADELSHTWEIIGVVADFHNEGLQKPLYPMVWNNNHPFEFGYYSVRVQNGKKQEAVDKLRAVWQHHYPKDPFHYFYAQDFFDHQYYADTLLGKFYIAITLLSITIACLGLYGLLLFVLHQKKQEIAIRKVNGASVADVLFLLNRPFLNSFAIAFAIACPVVKTFIGLWLEDFAYHTEQNWWMFVLSGLLALVVTIGTVSWQSYQAARRNPLDALRA